MTKYVVNSYAFFGYNARKFVSDANRISSRQMTRHSRDIEGLRDSRRVLILTALPFRLRLVLPEQTQIDPSQLIEKWERFVSRTDDDLSALPTEIADSW